VTVGSFGKKKYKTKDASMKKFKVNKFLVCKMVNLRTLKEKKWML